MGEVPSELVVEEDAAVGEDMEVVAAVGEDRAVVAVAGEDMAVVAVEAGTGYRAAVAVGAGMEHIQGEDRRLAVGSVSSAPSCVPPSSPWR